MLAFAVALLTVPGLTGCGTTARSDVIAVAGDTRYDPVTVQAPQITTPTLDVTLGFSQIETGTTAAFARTSTRQGTPRGQQPGAVGQQQGATGAGGLAPRAAGRLVSVPVKAGDHVRAGQVVAVFDDSLLRLGVDVATAAQRKATADVDVLNQRLDDLATAQDQLATARAQLNAGLAKLIAGRQALTSALAQLERLAALPPAMRPPGSPPNPAALLAQLRKQLALLDTGFAQAAAGQAKLASARAQLADAKQQLRDLRELAHILAQASYIRVQVAKYNLDAAVVRSDVNGVIQSAVPAGTVAMVGAPIVVIRKDGPTNVDVYLSPEYALRVAVGDRAEVRLDSLLGRAIEGRVTRVWPEETFPPTSYPTDIVHLSRVVRATVTVDERELPLGVPADVVITPKTGR